MRAVMHVQHIAGAETACPLRSACGALRDNHFGVESGLPRLMTQLATICALQHGPHPDCAGSNDEKRFMALAKCKAVHGPCRILSREPKQIFHNTLALGCALQE